MLEEVLASQPESAILSFLLVSPPRSFSEIELAKRLSLSSGTLSTTLQRMTRKGYVTTFSKRGKRYYLLNRTHAIFPELREQLSRNRSPKDELFSAIERLGEVKAAFLSGLFTGQPHLPVDVLIVGKVSPHKLDAFLSACERMVGQEINYSVMGPQEFRERRHTFDRFIKDIFDYPHIVVVDKLK